jgi:hypothetical protein
MDFDSDIGLERLHYRGGNWLRRSCVGWNSHAHAGADRRLRCGRSRAGRKGRTKDYEPASAMRRAVLFALPLLVAGCASSLTPPAQPTPASIESEIASLATITADPLTVWETGNYAVRAACLAYLNSAAAQQTSISLGSSAVGIAGAGASVANPLGGVAASLVQSFLSALSSSGTVPTTGDAVLIMGALSAYETGVSASPPASIPMAISYVDDLWFNCAPGGAAILAMKAKTSAQIGIASPPAAAFSSRGLAVLPRRPVITVNGN